MTLDESIDGLDKLESNSITAYADPNIMKMISSIGEINIDFIDNPSRTGAGYRILVGNPGDCSSGGCSGC